MDAILDKILLIIITAIVGGVLTYFAVLRKTKTRVDKLEIWQKAVNTDIECSAKERKILLRSMLACLYGLQEQGCNGPVTKGIETLENFLDDNAHCVKSNDSE